MEDITNEYQLLNKPVNDFDYNNLIEGLKKKPSNEDQISPDLDKSGKNFEISQKLLGNKKKKIYECSFENCDMIFTKQCILLDHIRAHNGEKPYKCSFENCKKSFTQLGNLKNHEKAHKTGNCFYCKFPGCNKSFTTHSYLKVK